MVACWKGYSAGEALENPVVVHFHFAAGLELTISTSLLPVAGLVKYALQNGQPVNSVLNGVLPLHAAASSGNETIVRMLIEHGADVNSPR